MEHQGPANIVEVNEPPPGDHGDMAADSLPQQALPVSNTTPGAIEEEFQVRI